MRIQVTRELVGKVLSMACGLAIGPIGAFAWSHGDYGLAIFEVSCGAIIVYYIAIKAGTKKWALSVPPLITIERPTVKNGVRGLILCGGGGKGAYQLGAIRALMEANLHFEVIAGTSVGALNGALLLSVGVHRARRVFMRTLKTSFKPWSLRSLAVGFLRLYSSLGIGLSFRRPRRVTAGIGFLLLAIGLTLILLSEKEPTIRTFLLVCFFVCFVPLWIPYGVWLLFDYFNIAALSTSRLERTVRAVIDNDKLRYVSKFYVTVARETDLTPMPYLGIFRPGPVFVPQYVEAAASADISQWLLASASVPFGILPHRKIGNEIYVDGGVVDNAPILPALEFGCEQIFVIHGKEGGTANGNRITEPQGLVHHLSRCLLLRGIGMRGSNNKEAVNALQRELSNQQLKYRAEIIHIVPSKPIGSLVKSLIFRGPKKTRQLDRLGYGDAVTTIKKLGLIE